ncbi:histidine phosphatase family protein [Pelagibius sp. Alg239-R121]|uniref:histidine phosphatase family protein n=1 Tax=Pelagibius sp. Alg239-R121 TaxID=2993448 RepID=UPI0024A6BEEC|nr:histidine phosphatase family protein [Pelagibius sp. Alg239-R121]
MTLLFILRHGVTSWNAEGRIQGQSDIGLSETARVDIPGWRLPDEARASRWLTSPLLRARETAALLEHPDAQIDERLREMHWGQWEGWRLTDLRRELGDKMVQNEAKGLDLQPPGGESPRDLQIRLKPLLSELGEKGEPTTAISHKGIIRALYSLASGWDMTGKPPTKLLNDCCHAFRLSPDGTAVVESLNIPLTTR